MRVVLFVFLSLFLTSQSWAQSNLPDCTGDPEAYRDNCFGTRTGDDGDKYVREWKRGKNNRLGLARSKCDLGIFL